MPRLTARCSRTGSPCSPCQHSLWSPPSALLGFVVASAFWLGAAAVHRSRASAQRAALPRSDKDEGWDMRHLPSHEVPEVRPTWAEVRANA